ncbi:MAG TPA: hypothetical protein VEH82_06585 [Acidimicrobiales bacterium]|nr:hypothetical protein [Acidimicrobiales bacterium]
MNAIPSLFEGGGAGLEPGINGPSWPSFLAFLPVPPLALPTTLTDPGPGMKVDSSPVDHRTRRR